jgi:hypothetical protein
MTAVDVCTISKWQVGQGQVHWRRSAGRACDDAGHADHGPALAMPAVPAIKDLRFTLRLYRTPQGLGGVSATCLRKAAYCFVVKGLFVP